MIYAVGFLAFVALLLAFVVYVLLTRPEKPTGAPTPEEAKITDQYDEITKKVQVTTLRDKEKLEHADANSLVLRIRNRILGVRK